jgi:hypothetical protein
MFLAATLGVFGVGCSGNVSVHNSGAGGEPGGDTGGSSGSSMGTGGTGGSAIATGGVGAGGIVGGGGGVAGSLIGGGPATGGASGGSGPIDGGSGGASSGSDAGFVTTNISSIRDGTFGLGSLVTLEGLFIMAVKQTANQDVTVYLQEQVLVGVLPVGIAAIIPAGAGTATLPLLTDCMDLRGTVEEFHGLTRIRVSSWHRHGLQCGVYPAPFVVAVGDLAKIATDADSTTAGEQPGTMAERAEAILVSVRGMRVFSDPDANGNFVVGYATAGPPVGPQPSLVVDSFFYAHPVTSVSSFSSITGIFTQDGHYVLQPRSAADFVQ